MASLTISVNSDGTGPLSISANLSEEDMQRVFAAIISKYPKTTFDDQGNEIPRGLGICLKSEALEFINAKLALASEHERAVMLASIKELAPPTAAIEIGK